MVISILVYIDTRTLLKFHKASHTLQEPFVKRSVDCLETMAKGGAKYQRMKDVKPPNDIRKYSIN